MLRLFLSTNYPDICRHLIPTTCRCISSTPHLTESWMDKVKGVFTGRKKADDAAESFTLLRFAEAMSKARKLGTLKQYVVGRGSEATFADAFEKQEAILRYLGGCDPNGEAGFAIGNGWYEADPKCGTFHNPTIVASLAYPTAHSDLSACLENIQISQKKEAAKQCNCTVTDVENALAKFTWAKEAQKKVEKLKEEGKPMPKSLAEVQKLMGSSPLDFARSNMAKSGQISRNASCPCGSKKLYKRCCGKDKSN